MAANEMRVLLREWLLRWPFAYRLLRSIRRSLNAHKERSANVLDRLESLFPVGEAVFFVQVGSNDGRHGDPLRGLIKTRKYWSGIFIEPVPYAMDGLKANYGSHSRFAYENVAVSDAYERRRFYYVSQKAAEDMGESLPAWHDQLGSFDPDHIAKHLDGLLEPYKVSVEVVCMPLNEILKRHRVDKIDLIHIDTEGYDYQVLKQIDFVAYQPKAILFENHHLSAADNMAAIEMLEASGYGVEPIGGDSLATLQMNRDDSYD